MNRKECLEESIKCVCTDREGQYGSPENNFSLIAELWSAYKGETFTAEDVAMMMALLKIARIKMGKHNDDNYVDLAGYAACACELRFPEVGKTCEEPTEEELKEKMKNKQWVIANCGVNKETNEPMLCSEIGGCRKCLFGEIDCCYESMREWVEDHFTDAGKMVGTDTNVGTKKPKFRLEDYKGRYVMHCDTEEKAKIFCRYLHENGCNWMDGDWYISDTRYSLDKEKTCYEFGSGLHGNLYDYMDMSFEILEFEDFDWSEYGEGK